MSLRPNQQQQQNSDLNFTIAELASAVRDLREELRVHAAEHRPLEETLKHIERTVYGEKRGQNGGLVTDVQTIKNILTSLERVLWIVVTPILTAIGVGIVYIVVNVYRLNLAP